MVWAGLRFRADLRPTTLAISKMLVRMTVSPERAKRLGEC